jgi:hypothetical protein
VLASSGQFVGQRARPALAVSGPWLIRWRWWWRRAPFSCPSRRRQAGGEPDSERGGGANLLPSETIMAVNRRALKRPRCAGRPRGPRITGRTSERARVPPSRPEPAPAAGGVASPPKGNPFAPAAPSRRGARARNSRIIYSLVAVERARRRSSLDSGQARRPAAILDTNLSAAATAAAAATAGSDQVFCTHSHAGSICCRSHAQPAAACCCWLRGPHRRRPRSVGMEPRGSSHLVPSRLPPPVASPRFVLYRFVLCASRPEKGLLGPSHASHTLRGRPSHSAADPTHTGRLSRTPAHMAPVSPALARCGGAARASLRNARAPPARGSHF